MAGLEYTVYPIAPRGLATSFTEADIPDEYAMSFKNRFINAAGGAEKRQGITDSFGTVPGSPTVTGLHELMLRGSPVFFCSANGKIYRDDSGTWTEVYSSGTSTGIYRSVQMGKKLIFYNGIDRNIYTEDGSTFKELKAIIERGKNSSGADRDSLASSDITNWVADTQVRVNDLIYNQTLDAHAIINAIATASVGHTQISSSAQGIGIASVNAGVNDVWEIIDLVELNVVPNGVEDDNVALQAVDSSTAITVSAVADWTKTEVRVGDYIRNTTKSWVTEVTAISTASLSIVGAECSAGDSLLLFRSAMPVADRAHVHFGRFYAVDERDDRTIAISGPNNPEDMTTDAGTLDSSTLSFGSYQPTADKIIAFTSFQRFIAFCGLRNIFLFEGTTPIIDATAQSVDFDIVGLFPQGAVAGDGVVSLGNDLVYVSVDGIQSIAMQGDASTLGRDNLSEPLRTTLRDEIAVTSPSDIFVFHYPRRSWMCAKIGTKMYVYNYAPYLQSRAGENQQFNQNRGSWSLFDGKFARQKVFYVNSDGDLICAGSGGKVYKFDQGDYDDDGELYSTEYRTGWLGMEPRRKSPLVKAGRYIRPIVDAGDSIDYNISVEAPFSPVSNDSVVHNVSNESGAIGVAIVGQATIGGSSIVDKKIPLRWRGKEARFTFSTLDNKGPDVLSRFTVYYTKHGAR